MSNSSTADTMKSKSTGATKAAGARISGFVGVFETLAKQHGEVSALMARVQRDASKRAELWPTIRAELISHEQGEIREVYPVLRQHAATRELADHHDQEASELSGAINRVDALAPNTPAWGEAFDKVVDLVTHHVGEEENDIFPKAQKAIGEACAREIEPKFLDAKAKVMAGV